MQVCVRPRVYIIEVITNFEIELINEGHIHYFLAKTVAIDHQNKDDEANRYDRAYYRNYYIATYLPYERSVRLFIISVFIIRENKSHCQ